jgi:hypothetical protein
MAKVTLWKSPFGLLPCANCGHTCPKSSTTCPRCGCALHTDETANNAGAPPQPTISKTRLYLSKSLFAIVGLPFLVWSLYLTLNNVVFISSASRAQGVVSEISKSGGKYNSHFPRVKFKTARGEEIEITGNALSSYEVGDSVEVLYDPASPKSAKINAPIQLWLLPLILFLPGAFFTYTAFGPTVKIAGGLARLFGVKVK